MAGAGDAYYKTAVSLRAMAETARKSYAEVLVTIDEHGPDAVKAGAIQHANNLIIQSVGFEIAAALQCVAQGLEDLRGAR